MPYIKKEDQDRLDDVFPNVPDELTSGELNYIITTILLLQQPKRYEDYNRLIGVLESCKLEFYRRAVAVYEDEKCRINGDVYE